jgi:hypothetical protein
VYFDPEEIEESIGIKYNDFDAAEKAICSVLKFEMEHIYFEGEYTDTALPIYKDFHLPYHCWLHRELTLE